MLIRSDTHLYRIAKGYEVEPLSQKLLHQLNAQKREKGWPKKTRSEIQIALLK